MVITREFLTEQIINLNRQIAAYSGAVEFAQMLLTQFGEDEAGMTVQDFAEKVAGPGATATMEQAHE